MTNWPNPLEFTRPVPLKLNSLHHQRSEFIKEPGDFVRHTTADEWLCGYAIPPFQRPLVWKQDQMVRFVESAVLGLNLGSYTFNDLIRLPDWMEIEPRSQYWLIDGQQRLNALDRFWNDEFPVFGMYWSEVDKGRRRQFLMDTSFPAVEVSLTTEAELRDLYDRMNYGGTAHTEEYRATAGYTR